VQRVVAVIIVVVGTVVAGGRRLVDGIGVVIFVTA
jgi:hypothetical protein